MYYNQLEHSPYDSLCKEPNFFETEEDMSDYASPSPLDYEVPDQSTENTPETPAREPEGPSSYPPTLPRKGCNTVLVEAGSLQTKEKEKLTLSKLYTALTHTHIPSVYCTPSHSMEFRRTNTAVFESTLDIVNLESSGTTASPPPTPLQHKDKSSLSLHQPYRHYSRAKVAVLVFLVTAITVAIISLGVSIVAVFVVTESGTTSATTATSEAAMMENITSLQTQIQQLEREVEHVRNETNSATLELSSLYQNCLQEIRKESCSLPNSEGFVCVSDPLPLEKEVCSGESYTETVPTKEEPIAMIKRNL